MGPRNERKSSSTTASSRIARNVAHILLKSAVSINSRQPFTFTSGIKSPIYTDNRLLISYPEDRERIVDAFAERIDELLGVGGVDVVAGTATAGIPWAAWLAARLEKPMVYVRASAKEHGRGQQIEGRRLLEGERVVVIEDHISTGGSSIQAIEAIRRAGGAVTNCLAISSYDFKQARQAFAEIQAELVPLTDIWAILEVAASEGKIDSEDRQAVLDWLAPHR